MHSPTPPSPYQAWTVVLLFSALSMNQCAVWFTFACVSPDVVRGSDASDTHAAYLIARTALGPTASSSSSTTLQQQAVLRRNALQIIKLTRGSAKPRQYNWTRSGSQLSFNSLTRTPVVLPSQPSPAVPSPLSVYDIAFLNSELRARGQHTFGNRRMCI